MRKHVNSPLKCSGKIAVDNTSPDKGAVGFYKTSLCKEKLSYLLSSDTVHACWSGIKDAESGIEQFVITLIEKTNSKVMQKITLQGKETKVNMTRLTIRDGVSYRLSLTAVNRVYMGTTTVSPWLLADRSAPNAGRVTAQIDNAVRVWWMVPIASNIE